MGSSAVRWANTGGPACGVCLPSQPHETYSSERTARHSAAVLDWRSDKLFAGSDSFVACLGRPRCFA